MFASNKNRTNPAANLHTNFKLGASPGYLPLTHDIAGGGLQVVQEFNPYPQQATYHKLTAAINHAKDHGDLATLRRMAEEIEELTGESALGTE